MNYLRLTLFFLILIICLTECFKLINKKEKKDVVAVEEKKKEKKKDHDAGGKKQEKKKKKDKDGDAAAVAEAGKKHGKEKEKKHGKDKKAKKENKNNKDAKSKILLTTDEFKLSVEEDDITFIMFFAPWCGFCKRVSPIWEKLAEKYNENDEFDRVITVGKIDCTEQIVVCYDNDIQSYPTIILYKNGGESVEYEGEHEFEAFEEFLMTQLNELDEHGRNDGLHELNEDNFDATVEDGYAFVDFYTTWCPNCAKLEPVWENLADTFKLSNVKIARIECTKNENVCDLYEIEGYPTLLLFQDGRIIGNYNSAPSYDSLVNFLTEKVTDLDMDFLEEDLPGEVHEVAQSNYTDFMKFKGVVFLEFYTTWCTYCRNLEPIWKELAAKYIVKDPVRIARIDCTPNGEICKKNNVTLYPTLIIYKMGQKLEEYIGANDIKSLVKFVESKLNGLKLHEL